VSWKDLLYGVLVPTVVALIIIGVGLISSTILVGLKYSLLEAVVLVSVPMLIGLIWNKWAGGSAGFLMGSFYALYYSDQLYASIGGSDVSLLANLVSAMLIGYIAGALSRRSIEIKQMMTAGVVAAIMGGLIVVMISPFSAILEGTTPLGLVLTFLPRILAGVLVPFIARLFLKHVPTNH